MLSKQVLGFRIFGLQSLGQMLAIPKGSRYQYSSYLVDSWAPEVHITLYCTLLLGAFGIDAEGGGSHAVRGATSY